MLAIGQVGKNLLLLQRIIKKLNYTQKKTRNSLSFFYNNFGDDMKVYLDYVFFLNFSFDFLLLLTVSIILRRNIPIKRIILGALVGGISIFLLFIKLNSIQLFLLKLMISILMIIVTFSYKNIRYTIKNISYLYLSSIVLGGALYLLNIQFSYSNEGLIFYHNGLSINVIVLVILSPFILYTYIKQTLQLKNTYSQHHRVNITYHGKIIKLNAFLDTGNQLVDPITKLPVVIIQDTMIRSPTDFILVPYQTVSGPSMMRCLKADSIEIDGKIIQQKFLLGLTKNLNMEGIDCILNPILMEEIT